MTPKQHTIDILKIAGLVLVLASLLFAIAAWAQAPATANSTEADQSGAQDAPEADIGAAEEAPDPSVTGSGEKSWWQKRQARRRARVEARREQIAARMREAPRVQAAPAAPLGAIRILFKLDPRLTQSLYMGERWVSPPTYTQLQDGKSLIVEARAEGRDTRGQPVQIRPEWSPADPEIVRVTHGPGDTVLISVRRPGESKLKVTSQGVSTTLAIKATASKNDVLQVEISQQPART